MCFVLYILQSPAARFYSFRSKKKRWSMHTLPINTPSPTHPHTLGLSDPSENQTFTDSVTTPCDSTDDGTYVAKSNSLAHSPKVPRTRAKSYCNSDSQQSVRSLLDLEENSESCSEATTPGYSPQMARKVTKVREPESGYNTSSSVQNRVRQLSISEEPNKGTCSESTNKEVVRTETKTSVVKRTQSPKKLTDSPTRRTITSPVSSRTRQSLSRKANTSPSQSPVSSRARPRMLSTGGPSTKRSVTKSKTISSSRTSSTASTPNRTPSLSRTPSGSRPLSSGRTSRTCRVREKTSSLQRRPKSMIETSSNSREVVEPKNTTKAIEVNKDKVDMTEEITSPDITITQPSTNSVTELETENPVIDSSLPSTTPETEEENCTTISHQPEVAQTSEDKMLPKEASPIAEPSPNIESDNQSQANEEINSSSSLQTLEPQLSKDTTDQATDTQVSPSTPENKKPKHTVAYSQESPLFKDGKFGCYIL